MEKANKRKNLVLCMGIIISYLIMIAMNAAANGYKFNGLTTGEVSDSYPNLFAPAGITFSIWGIIYLALLVYVVYSVMIVWKKEGSDSDCRDTYLDNTAFYFMVSSIGNAVWIILWHFQLLFASVIMMGVILWCLYLINRSAARVYGKCCLKEKEQLLIRLPFGIYFGWITVASIANITTLLVSYGVDGGKYESLITDAVLLIGLVIASLVISKQHNIFYGMAVIWAYLGILVKHLSADGFAGKYPDIIAVVVICLVGLLIVEITTWKRNQ